MPSPKSTNRSNGHQSSNEKFVMILVDLGISAAITALGYVIYEHVSTKIMKKHAASNGISSTKVHARLRQLARRRAGIDDSAPDDGRFTFDLNDHELVQAENVIDPEMMTTTFADVGGIDEIKQEIFDLVVLPFLQPSLFTSSSGLVSPPNGVLLYGSPGTGKTMLAKAIAKESNATFVNVRLSSIMNKWLGESNKMVSAVFSIARKLAPSVIFIDEIDTFLRQRDNDESAMGSTKSEFLTLWDGILTEGSPENENGRVVVLGCTNRPGDVDTAILRRLPRQFQIGLPPPESRLKILQLILKKQPMTAECERFLPEFCTDKFTKFYSGSDLKELCRAAAMIPIREITNDISRKAVNCPGGAKAVAAKGIEGKVRPMTKNDLLTARTKVLRTGLAAETYREEIATHRDGKGITQNGVTSAEIMNAFFNLLKSSDDAGRGGGEGGDDLD